MTNIAAITVNFNTKHLIEKAVTSFRKFYPEMQMLVIDNGSEDGSREWLIDWKKHDLHFELQFNTSNKGHGPALHDGMLACATQGMDYAFTWDSDCEALKGGFIEDMLEYFNPEFVDLYAIGWLRYVQRQSGVPVEWHIGERDKAAFVAYVHPCAAIYDVVKYGKLRPFFHHGAPALHNMLDAEAAGYDVSTYPIFDYVKHLVGGTRRMYTGVNVGDWNPPADMKPRPWDAKANLPI